jgi:hypothetical protein
VPGAEPEPSQAPDPGVLFLVPSPAGYLLVADPRQTPARGASVELAAGVFTVLRVGPSPLADDPRRCAFLEREEPPGPGRSPDG